MTGSTVDFRKNSVIEIGTSRMAAVQMGVDRLASHRRQAVAEYTPMEEMRDQAEKIRHHTIQHLGYYMERFADRIEQVGGQIHFAADSDEAVSIVADIVEATGGVVIKSKSMVTEEIELNHRLELAGHTVVETDLGEFIAQLADERPSHIIAPVLHKTRQEIGRLFADRLNVAYTDDPAELNELAREHLRRIFLAAGVGISGVNFGVAETGSVVTVTNEGNGRLTTTTPPVHIAVMGTERLVPGEAELAVMLEVLARSATGQRLSVYSSVMTGPRRPGEPDGPEQLHVVVVDNGRSRLIGGDYEEALACIRCGACLNVCPVYRQVGGHAYGSIYSGPIGAVISPALFGIDRFGDLPYASTLCGACLEVCPVRIDLPRMLLALRQEAAASGHLARAVAGGVRIYGRMASNPRRWRLFWRWAGRFSALGAKDGWLQRLPGPGAAWSDTRALRRPARRPFLRGTGAHRG
jgi:L-lactate dehydrogenase complex protein LldF